jgi:hypothetical protein
MPFPSLALRFLLLLVAATVMMMVILYLTDVYLGLDGNSGTALAPTMLASLMCGQAYARKTGRRPSGGTAWGVAAMFAGITLVCSVAMLFLFDAEVRAEFLGVRPAVLLTLGLAMTLVLLLVARIFFGLGSRTWHAPARA